MKNLTRVLSVALCAVLIFFCCYKPVQVSAVEPVTITLGALGSLVEVLPYVALGAFLLIACGYVIETLPQLVDDINLWYSELPDLKEWALSVGQDLQEGTIVIIPEFVQEAMRKKAEDNKSKTPDNMPYILLPPNFHQLDQVTQEQLFNQQINTTLQQGNSLLTQIKNSLTGFAGNVANYFGNLGTEITNCFATLSTTFKAEFDQFKTWYVNINENLKAEIHQIPNWLSNINTNMKTELGQVKTWFSNINTNMKSEFMQVRDWLSGVKTSIVSGFTNLELKLEELLKPDTEGTGGGNSNTGTNSGTADPSLEGTAGEGVNQSKVWFGASNSFLGEYASAFLVAGLIFNQFADIPIINKLLIISACIGLVGAFLGIALNVSSKESYAGKKAKVGGN